MSSDFLALGAAVLLLLANAFFVAAWLVSGLLFRRASLKSEPVGRQGSPSS